MRYIFLILSFCCLNFFAAGQTFNYVKGSFDITVRGVNPCGGSDNGYLQITVNAANGGSARLIFLDGPGTLDDAGVDIGLGAANTYTFAALPPSSSLPDGVYNFIIRDQANSVTINTFVEFATYAPVTLTDLTSVTLTQDILTNNTVCTNPTTGQVQSSINGGSQALAGGGSYNYTWTSSNPGQTGFPLSATTNGTTPLNLATLLGVPGLPGGTYTLNVTDNFGVCGTATRSFVITDPSPAIQTVTTSSPLNICAGDNITLTMNNSEIGVTYTILRNGIPTANTFAGTASGVFVMNFPSTGFADNDIVQVRATNGFCSPSTMANSVILNINPLPTISGFNVAAICQGSTSASLTYTSTTGSPNQYSIDYDAIAEGQGFVDVPATALPASPIALTVPGGAAPATYNATLTVINSVTGCPAVPVAIGITIIANPSITLGTNPTVCIGAATANLTYSATTGTPNQYSIDFNAGAEAQGFVDVTNAVLPATPIVITVPAIAVAGIYSANLTVRNSVTGCLSASQPITVTINANPTITLGPNPSVCSGTTTTNLTYSAVTGGPDQYTIDFNGAAQAAGFVDVANAPLPASPIVITVPAGAAPGVYNASIIVSNAATSCISVPQNITVTVIASPTITLGASPSVCLGAATANLPYTGTTGGANQYSINFDVTAEGQGFVDIVNVVLTASPIVITIPVAAIAGTYNAQLSVLNTVTGCTSPAQAITVTINPTPTITLGANPSVCSGTTPANLTYSATTGSPNQYSIDFNAAAELQGFVDVVNAALPATPIAIVVPGAAVAGVYSASITVRNSTTGCVSAASPITVTINATPTITLGANPSVCLGATTANLTYSATTGTPNQYSLNFNAAAEAQGFVDVVNAALPASPIAITIPGVAVPGTYTASLTILNTTTGCVSAAQAVTVTISPVPTITLGANPSVCVGSTTANLSYSAVTGTPNQYSIDFNAAANGQGFVDVTNAALPASPIAITVPGAAVAGTYNATLTVTNSVTGCVSASQPITVTINANPTITLGPNPSVCSGTTTTNLTYSATTGGPDQYTIDFNGAAQAAGFVDVANAALTASPIVITVPAGAAPGVYNATIIVSNAASTCISTPQAITVTVVANPTITLGTNPSVCEGATTANLPFTATTGTPNQFSINFDAAAEGQGFADVVNAALPATPIVITVPGAAVAGTYNATLTVLNTTTGCISASQAITVTISPEPTITLGANPTICSGTTTANLGYTAVTGTPNQYSIDFNPAAEAQGFVDVVNAALPATPIVITVPAGAIPGTYTGSLTVSNSTSGCVSAASAVSVTIDLTPAITLGANPSVCSGSTSANLPYTGTTGTPDQYSIDFNGTAEAQGFVDVTNVALPVTPIVITVPGTTAAGVYNATLIVRNSISGCVSSSSPITVTVLPSPTATITGTATICAGSSTNLTVTFTGTAPWTFTYSDGTTTSAPINSPFVTFTIPVSPATTTTYTIVSVSDATVCPGIVNGSAVVTVNQPPLANLTVGVTIDPLCSGGVTDITVVNSQIGVSYQLRDDAGDVPIGPPVVGTGATINLPSGVLTANTTFNVLATAAGCTPVELTDLATVTVAGAINAGLSVTAAVNPLCSGNSTDIQVANSENGVLYQLRNDATDANVGAVVAGNGGTINLPTGVLGATTAFNVLASNGTCSLELTDIETVTVSPSPDASLAVAVTLTPLCVGGSTTITVALSETGISYQLRNDAGDVNVGAPIVGTGGTIAFPTGALAATTTFNVLATGPGCPAVELASLATVTVSGNVDATLSVVAAASPICQGTGTDIQIALSESGVTYQLRDDATDTPIGAAVAGNGGTILLPTGNLTATTTFNVLASNGACSIELADLETVNVDVAPNPALVVDVTLDPLCVGGVSAVTIASSQVGVTYQLRNDADDSDVGAAVVGNGGTISLSTGVLNATTVFNILATSGVCPAVELAALATVTVAGTVDAGLTVSASVSPICAGTSTFIQVQASETGVTYQLRNDADDSAIGAPVAGTGAAINLPTGNLATTTTFNVVANNGACSIELTDLETVTVTPAPSIALAVNAASTLICSGTSTNIVVVASENGVSYQLRNDADDSNVGPAVVGNGGNILLPTGNLTANATFNVLATVGTCSAQLTATPTVTIRPLGDPACGGGGTDCANFNAIIPTIVTQPSCNDRDAGEVSFTISRFDGTPTTFRVLWTIGGTTQTKFTSNTVSFDDLSSGAYQYTIIDEGNGKTCGPVDFFLDLKTQVEILDKQVTANVTCYGGTDGNAILTVDGTTTGEYWYKYVLDGIESSAQTFTPGAPLPGGLPADDDDFIIIKVDETFNFLCPDTVMVRIKHTFSKIDYTVSSTEVTTCNGTDGSILVGAISGGDSGTNPLQVRLKKAVPFTTDPSGYIVLIDFEDVVNGVKEYPDLSQGNYVVDVKDHLDCIQSKPIAVQAPGQVPLASVAITTTNNIACQDEGPNGSITVVISDAGQYELAVSLDPLNVPADDQFVDYSSPSFPNVVFNGLTRGAYYLYIKSSTTTCPTRSDAINIDGFQGIGNFEVLSNCGNQNLTINNITGQVDAPFVIRVFDNDDTNFKIDSLTSSTIPVSRSVTFVYNPPLQHSFLSMPGTYRFVMVQTQTFGASTCVMASDTVVYDVRLGLGITLGEVKPSFPAPKRTGSIEIADIDGGTRFTSPSNELYYEVALYDADADVVVEDWTEVKLDPQNKFTKLYEYLPPGVYRIKVRDASGCEKTIDAEIMLDPSVYVPNVFTPNDDSVNDTFEVLNLPLTGTHKLIVSNRWGNEVFKSNDYRDGNFWNANDTSDGIYFYRLQVDGGDTYTGWVEIIRGNKP